MVVSDAAPLRYLILIDQIHLLGLIFGRVVLPKAVARELQHEHTPEKVKAWIVNPPEWLEERTVSEPDRTIDLGAGEQEAITLVQQSKSALLLVDDGPARKLAGERGIAIVGTLGILEEAARRDLIQLSEVIRRLRTETNFRGTSKLYEASLERDRKFRQSQELGQKTDEDVP
jgi:predicted nucleic acid-binding protein